MLQGFFHAESQGAESFYPQARKQRLYAENRPCAEWRLLRRGAIFEKEIIMAEKANQQDRMRGRSLKALKTASRSCSRAISTAVSLHDEPFFHRYSVNNTMLIYMQRPDATHVAGFNKWRDQFGRNDMKKAKKVSALSLLLPIRKGRGNQDRPGNQCAGAGCGRQGHH